MRNKKLLVVVALVAIGFSLAFILWVNPEPVEAQLGGLPFGGKTIIPPIGLICPGEIFNISPVKPVFPVGPYFVSPTARRYKYYSVAPGRWIKGRYVLAACETVSGTPVPAFMVTMYGTSLFSLF
ncbi:hypothetical protein HY967_00320 [Candidatus Jorgensenbacteria bacterium]|nr:hypothetical protein [Candidatus Jorgensenbacteria bacterium]